MKLTVVGCSGSVPGPDGPASCYLVESGDVRLLLDLGNGAFGPLQRYVDPAELDAVILTHLHADHCADMSAFAVFREFGPGGRLPEISVLGPAGTAEEIDNEKLFGVEDLAAGSWEIGPFEITAARTNHPVVTYAIRLEADGRSLTYSADTGRSKGLVELARDSDVLLCEATFETGRDIPDGVHLTGDDAGVHARKAGVGRLLLTHIPPWNDPVRILGEACSAFSGLTEVVSPGATYLI